MSSPFLIEKDRRMIEGIQLYLRYRDDVLDFQFPPTIEGDARRVNWKTGNVPGRDPVATYESNSAREMTLKFHYIVENPSTEILGDIWTIGRIKLQLNTLKGYFTAINNPAAQNPSDGSLIAYFIHTRITGGSSWSVRIGNINATYSGPSIGGVDNGFDQHPLKTTVTLDLATVSSGTGGDLETYWDGIREFPAFEDLWY